YRAWTGTAKRTQFSGSRRTLQVRTCTGAAGRRPSTDARTRFPAPSLSGFAAATHAAARAAAAAACRRVRLRAGRTSTGQPRAGVRGPE
ncbi:hypothetical protein C1X89_35255, partial [Pseudomonas sp. GP01-A8]